MRLNSHQIAVIKQSVADIAGPSAVVRLFGSRTDDNRRGGDIDLLVDVPDTVNNVVLLQTSLSARMSTKLDGQKIDVIVKAKNLPILPIHKVALDQGIVL